MRRMMVAGLGLVLLTGCSGGADTATPAGTATSEIQVPSASPTPSPMMTTNGTLDPSSPASDAVSTDPLYQEAVRVYTAYSAEMTRIEEAGTPSAALPPVMDRYITGSMKEAVVETTAEAHRLGYRLEKKPESVLVAVAPLRSSVQKGTAVAIQVCADATHRKIFDHSGKVIGAGALVFRKVQFQQVGNDLKAAVTEDQEVSKCPIR